MVLLNRNNSPQVITSLHSDRLFRLKTDISLILLINDMSFVAKQQIHFFIVFGLSPLSEIMVECKRVSGIWTVLRSLVVKYNTQQLSIIYSVLGLDVEGSLKWYIHHLPLYLCQIGHPIRRCQHFIHVIY